MSEKIICDICQKVIPEGANLVTLSTRGGDHARRGWYDLCPGCWDAYCTMLDTFITSRRSRKLIPITRKLKIATAEKEYVYIPVVEEPKPELQLRPSVVDERSWLERLIAEYGSPSEVKITKKGRWTYYDFCGFCGTINDWADKAHIKPNTLWDRLNRQKLPFQEALRLG